MNTAVLTNQTIGGKFLIKMKNKIVGPTLHTDNGIQPKTAMPVEQMRIQNNLLNSDQ